MDSRPPPIRRDQHVCIKVHDLDESMEFYRDVMGYRVSDRYEPGDNPHSKWGICFMSSGELHHEIFLICYIPESGPPPRGEALREPGVGLHHIAYEVEGKQTLEAWEKHISAHGIEIMGGPVVHSPTHTAGDGTLGENRAFYFHGPYGNGIQNFTDMTPMDAGTNRIDETWFRDRLERDGLEKDMAELPPAWQPGISSMTGAKDKFKTEKSQFPSRSTTHDLSCYRRRPKLEKSGPPKISFRKFSRGLRVICPRSIRGRYLL